MGKMVVSIVVALMAGVAHVQSAAGQTDTVVIEMNADVLRFDRDAGFEHSKGGIEALLREQGALNTGRMPDTCRSVGGLTVPCVRSWTRTDTISTRVVRFLSPFPMSGGRMPGQKSSWTGQDTAQHWVEYAVQWVPVPRVLGGADSVVQWNAEARTGRRRFCSEFGCRIVTNGVMETSGGTVETLSDCAVFVVSGDVGVPKDCAVLAIKDENRWWVKAIAGYTIFFPAKGWIPPLPPSPTYGGLSSFGLTPAYLENLEFAEYFSQFDVIVVHQGRLGSNRLLAAVADALGGSPLSLETRRMPTSVQGVASYKVSGVIPPHRHIVEVLVVADSADRVVTLRVFPRVLVSRYRTSNAVAYHGATAEQEGRYRTALRDAIRKKLEPLCPAPRWSAQYLYCDQSR